MYQNRVQRVLDNLATKGCRQAIIADPLSIFYLTGYYAEPYERFLALYISPDDCTLFVNRLFPSAEQYCDRIEVHDDTDNPLPAVVKHIHRDETLGLDKMFPARWTLPLINNHVAKQFILASFAVDDTRSHKDKEERNLMRDASRINDKAMGWLQGQIRVGVAEQEIAEGLLGTYRSLGAQNHSFSPIVSFGANSADPHHMPDNTKLKPGDMVLFDVGCKKDMYCSDMTRTFFTAEPTDEQEKAYETVRRANEAAESLVAPGVTFAELDDCARSIISDAGYGQYFTHRLGHQIGLSDHEPGDVSSTHTDPVEPGQIFSIEPGIYIPGRFGVRIEDLVLVTDHGCEVLNSYPKDLTIVSVD